VRGAEQRHLALNLRPEYVERLRAARGGDTSIPWESAVRHAGQAVPPTLPQILTVA
jgi:hypothetical protein